MMPRFRTLPRPLQKLVNAFTTSVMNLETSFSPSITISRLRAHTFTLHDTVYIVHIVLASFWLTVMQVPPFPYKLILPILYAIALLLPITSQFFFPAIPIFSYLLAFFSSRFIPADLRPPISVSLLPTLESVLYGANISDILTRFTHPILDILAWFPYGVVHFTGPFFVAAFIWLFAPKPALKFFADAFGYLNLIGVLCQIVFPCAAPWYELIYGLTPANYSMKGSPGGLARIDALFHSHGYTTTFSNSPVVFGAFPSLHAGCATMEALFISHFFPGMRKYAWGYTAILYWATMYLTHHYLIDVVGGACLATACFYLILPPSLRYPTPASPRSKHEIYDLEAPPRRPASSLSSGRNSESSEDITFRSPNPITPNSAAPFVVPASAVPPRRSHRHTASIASLIGPDERTRDGWSPIGTKSFVFPPAGTPRPDV